MVLSCNSKVIQVKETDCSECQQNREIPPNLMYKDDFRLSKARKPLIIKFRVKGI